jgi:ABC-type sugar transport system ATPase subunit
LPELLNWIESLQRPRERCREKAARGIPGEISMNMSANNPIFVLEEITKDFPGVRALDKVSFEVNSGEVHALVGENGAGKSTLVKILAGLYRPDEGVMYYQGDRIEAVGPRQMCEMGISVIYQELNLCHNLSVAANIFLGRERVKYGAGIVDEGGLQAESRKYLQMLDADIDPAAPVSSLSIAAQQLVEIAKALSYESQVIIMDEPTSSLTLHEVDKLLDVVRQLKADGKAIVFISHRLEEISTIADTVTVLRDGKLIGTHPMDQLDTDRIVGMMVGREVTHEYPGPAASLGDAEPLLAVKDLSSGDSFSGVTFELYPGEILGLSGLVGAGRTELLEAIYGLRPITSGQILLEGRQIAIASPGDAIGKGIAMTSEDRKNKSLFLNFRTRENVTISSLKDSVEHFYVSGPKERDIVRKLTEQLNVTPGDPEFMTVNMSGGNQQKVVLSKALGTEPRVLLMDEPTKGIDVGAKAELYEIIRQLAREGKGILCVSSELLEILGLCDRILVMSKGRLIRGFLNSEATEEKIMSLSV